MEYSEKEIEDCLYDNPHMLNLGLNKDGVGWEMYRQLDLKDYGIADLVIFDWSRSVIYVIEVKRNPSKPADFGQCLRYMEAMRKSGLKVRGIVAANGMSGDSPWVLSSLKHVQQWTFSPSLARGILWKYEPKGCWVKGTDDTGEPLRYILEIKGEGGTN